jgi:hypothetical protein
MSTVNPVPKGIALDALIENLSNDLISKVLLQSIEPLLLKIKPILVDHILTLRRQMLGQNEFMSISKAARACDITRKTLYDWIDKDIISCYMVDDRRVVSISEIKEIYNTVYFYGKNTKEKAP